MTSRLYLLTAFAVIGIAAYSVLPTVAAASSTGQVSGTVTDAATHNPIEGLEVCAFEAGGNEDYAGCVQTDSSGGYTITDLLPVSYKIDYDRFGKSKYIHQYYSAKSAWAEADPVSVTAGSTTSNIDAELHEGAQITGTVTDATTHEPIEGVQACPIEVGGNHEYDRCGTTNASGEYTVGGLPTSSYKVQFRPGYVCGESGCALQNYPPQYYSATLMWPEADPVAVTAGSTTGNVDAEMQEGGQLSGTATDAATHNPIEGVEACALEGGRSGQLYGCSSTDASGDYAINGLPTGSYIVEFFFPSGFEYMTQYYGGNASRREASPVPVTAGSTTPHIDAEMVKGGRVTGTVLDAVTHDPLSDASACAVEIGGDHEIYGCAFTEVNGEYKIGGLPTGLYKVEFYPGDTCIESDCNNQRNYLRQYYNDESTWTAAAAISVSIGSTTSNINAEMQEGGQISGTVSDAASHSPTADVDACAFAAGGGGETYGCGVTDASGGYTIGGLPTGSYVVRFTAGYYSFDNYAPEYYNDKATQAEASAVAVTVGSTTGGVDATMHEGGQITGTVTGAGTHSTIAGLYVCASEIGGEEDSSGGEEESSCVYPKGGGNYTISGLATGSYKVEFATDYYNHNVYVGLKYARQLYDGKSFSEEADLVSVTAGSTTGNVDAEMHEGGQITGTVTDAATHEPMEGVEACAVAPRDEEEVISCGYSNASGKYVITALGTAAYTVVFYPPNGSSDAIQYYSGKSSAHEATAVSVISGSTASGIDAALALPETKPVNTTAPSLTGTPAVGETLSCSQGSWEHSPTEYAYAWFRGSSPIGGATATTYQVQSADQGHSITCEVTATNADGAASATSNALSVPAAAGAPVNTTPPALTGTPALGEMLSCSQGSWENSPTSYAYAWRRDGGVIAGQSASTYTVQSADAGHGISCEVTATNGSGPGSAGSNSLQVPAKPVDTATPSLTGMPAIGQTLTCSNGSWENSPTSYAYAWKRDGSAIAGQSGATYVVTSDAQGHGITCEVTASNGGGSASATSNSLHVPNPSPPPTATPSLPHESGTGAVSSAATVKGGSALIEVDCTGSGPCSGVLRLIAQLPHKAQGKRFDLKKSADAVIGQASFSLPAGQSVTVAVKLNGKGKALLRHAGKRGLKVHLTGTGVTSRTVVLKEAAGRTHHGSGHNR